MTTPTPVPPPAEPAAKAWFSKVSEEIEKVPMSLWKQLAVFFFAALFIGFVIKRYIAYVLFAAVIATFILWFLHYVGAAQFDFLQLRTYFGISQDASIGEFIADIFKWAKGNIGLVFAALVGFIIGLQIG